MSMSLARKFKWQRKWTAASASDLWDRNKHAHIGRLTTRFFIAFKKGKNCNPGKGCAFSLNFLTMKSTLCNDNVKMVPRHSA
jgi:hypothetical protein